MCEAPSIYALLQKAQPRWSYDDLCKVCKKLSKVDISDADSLSRAVMEGCINQKLAQAGERQLKSTTIANLKVALQKPYRMALAAEEGRSPVLARSCYCGHCLATGAQSKHTICVEPQAMHSKGFISSAGLTASGGFTSGKAFSSSKAFSSTKGFPGKTAGATAGGGGLELSKQAATASTASLLFAMDPAMAPAASFRSPVAPSPSSLRQAGSGILGGRARSMPSLHQTGTSPTGLSQAAVSSSSRQPRGSPQYAGHGVPARVAPGNALGMAGVMSPFTEESDACSEASRSASVHELVCARLLELETGIQERGGRDDDVVSVGRGSVVTVATNLSTMSKSRPPALELVPTLEGGMRRDDDALTALLRRAEQSMKRFTQVPDFDNGLMSSSPPKARREQGGYLQPKPGRQAPRGKAPGHKAPSAAASVQKARPSPAEKTQLPSPTRAGQLEQREAHIARLNRAYG